MVKRIRAGRPSKAGPRFACGKRKNLGDVRAPTLWRRIKDHGVRLGIDPRLGAELGRLSLHGELTDGQVAVGLQVAAIYGGYDRLVLGRKRNVASPSYIMAYGLPDPLDAKEPLDEARMTAAELQRLQRRIARAKRDFERVQSALPTADARAIVEGVCVDDRPINSSHLDDLRILLDRAGALLGLTRSTAAVAAVAITAGKPRRSVNSPDQVPGRKAHVYRAPDGRPVAGAHRSDPQAAADRAETVRRLEERRARPETAGEGTP